MIGALLATLLFCVSAVTATRSARLMGGTEANFWRLSLAALMLAIYAHCFGSGLYGRTFPVLLVSGVVGFGIGDASLFQALPRLGSRLTILLVHCLAAPFAALCEWLWLGTKLSSMEIVCGIIILCGVSVAMAPSERLHIPRKDFWPGCGFAALAAFGQGFGAVLSRYAFALSAQAGENLDGITAAYMRIIAGVMFAGIVLLIVKRNFIYSTKPTETPASVGDKWRRSWHWISINALTGPALGVSCYQWALKTTPAGIVLPIVATTPLVIIPLSAKFEGEKAGRHAVVGGIIAVAGAVCLALFRTPSPIR